MDEQPDVDASPTDKMLKAGITKDNPWPATEEDLAPPNWRLGRIYCAPDGLHIARGGGEQVVEWGAIRHTSIKTHGSWVDGGPDSYVLLIEIWAGMTEVVKPFGWSGTTRRDRVERAMQAINDWRDCWQAQQGVPGSDGHLSGPPPSHPDSFAAKERLTTEVKPAKADMPLLKAYVVLIALAGAVALLIWAMALAPGWSGDSAGSWEDAEQAPTSGVTVTWTDLRLGDCIHDVWADDYVVVSCSDPHSGEVILTDESFYARDSAAPPEDRVTDREAAAAEAALQDYTGQPMDDGRHDYLVEGPNAAEWAKGVRRVVVYGTTLDFSDNEIETTGTMAAEGGG